MSSGYADDKHGLRQLLRIAARELVERGPRATDIESYSASVLVNDSVEQEYLIVDAARQISDRLKRDGRIILPVPLSNMAVPTAIASERLIDPVVCVSARLIRTFDFDLKRPVLRLDVVGGK